MIIMKSQEKSHDGHGRPLQTKSICSAAMSTFWVMKVLISATVSFQKQKKHQRLSGEGQLNFWDLLYVTISW